MPDTHEGTHTNYVKIWGILLVLLVVSIVGPMFGYLYLTLFTAFGIAIVKAVIVAAKFQHLNTEKRIVWYILITGIVCLVILFVGLAPDIMKKEGVNWRNLAAYGEYLDYAEAGPAQPVHAAQPAHH